MRIAHQERHEVRELAEGDLPALLALYANIGLMDGGTSAQLARTWAQILASDLLVYLGAFDAGVLAATCHAVIVPNLSRGVRPFAIIENVGTLDGHRRRGLGALVMRALLARCWEAGCYKVMLASGLGRGGAHQFYDALGFDRHAKQSFVLARPAGL